MSIKKTTPRGRDAGTGRFIPLREARRRPATTVIERVPVRSTPRKGK